MSPWFLLSYRRDALVTGCRLIRQFYLQEVPSSIGDSLEFSGKVFTCLFKHVTWLNPEASHRNLLRRS